MLLQRNDRITAENHFQDVRLLSLSCPTVSWSPGDVFVVRPWNRTERVDELFALLTEHSLDFGANTVVRLNEFNSGTITIQTKHTYFFLLSIRTIFIAKNKNSHYYA